MPPHRFVSSLPLLLFFACASDPETPVQPVTPVTPVAPVTDPPVLTRSVVESGLSAPWDVAISSDGALFYTERCAGLRVRRSNGTRARLFGTTGSALVAPDLFCLGQSGMNGVALDPGFATNRLIYVFMASTLTTSPRTNRVVRLQLDADYTTVSARIRFGPDGFLYIATGDNHNATLPQHPTLLGGKVLRVTTSGADAPGNNPPAGFDPRIFTYGLRNPQGIAFRPGSGQPFIAEHGPNHSDEVTRLVAGGNGGWDPQGRPSLTCPSSYCGYAGTPTSMPMTDLARFPAAP